MKRKKKNFLIFCQEFKNGVRFTSHLDPFRGTPYDLVDAGAANWLVQNYGAEGKIAYEIIPGWFSFGLQGSINVARGAKQIDPRPKTNNNEIKVMPSLSFHANGHVLSVAAGYDMFRENMNLILYNAAEPQKVYEMKGLGQYTYSIFSTSGRDRKYAGNGFSTALDYRWANDFVTIGLNGGYANYGEKASDIEQSKLKDLGKFYRDEITAALLLRFRTGRTVNTLSFDFLQETGSGREIFQVFDPSEEVNAWVTESEFPQRWMKNSRSFGGRYSFHLLSKTRDYSALKLDLAARYTVSDETYKVMDTYRNYRLLDLSFAPEYSFFMRPRTFCTLGLETAYADVSGFKAAYKEREAADHQVRDDFFGHDARVLAADHVRAGMNLDFGFALKNGSAFLLGMDYSYLTTLRPQPVLNRHFFGLSLSYNW